MKLSPPPVPGIEKGSKTDSDQEVPESPRVIDKGLCLSEARAIYPDSPEPKVESTNPYPNIRTSGGALRLVGRGCSPQRVWVQGRELHKSPGKPAPDSLPVVNPTSQHHEPCFCRSRQHEWGHLAQV